jgi:hypothetical protein
MAATPTQSAAPEVYKEYCADLRFYGDMRFKQLTVWSAGIGFLINTIYGTHSPSLTPYAQGALFACAAFWTAIIWVMEVRSSIKGARCTELKRSFEATHSSIQEKWTFLNATNAIALLYATTYLIVLVELLKLWGWKTVTSWVVLVAWCVVISFNIREYWQLWQHATKQWKW